MNHNVNYLYPVCRDLNEFFFTVSIQMLICAGFFKSQMRLKLMS